MNNKNADVRTHTKCLSPLAADKHSMLGNAHLFQKNGGQCPDNSRNQLETWEWTKILKKCGETKVIVSVCF